MGCVGCGSVDEVQRRIKEKPTHLPKSVSKGHHRVGAWAPFRRTSASRNHRHHHAVLRPCPRVPRPRVGVPRRPARRARAPIAAVMGIEESATACLEEVFPYRQREIAQTCRPDHLLVRPCMASPACVHLTFAQGCDVNMVADLIDELKEEYATVKNKEVFTAHQQAREAQQGDLAVEEDDG